MMSLHYLVYVSRAATALDADRLRHLEASASAFNQSRQVTGVLVQTAGCFFQWLEGPADGVAAAMQRVRADTMHHTILVLEEGPLQARAFSGWAMVAHDFPAAAPLLRVIEQLQPWLVDHADHGSPGPARFMDLTQRFVQDRLSV